MDRRRTLLALGLGTNQLDYLVAATRVGWNIVGVDQDPQSNGRSLCEEFLQLPISDTDGIVTAMLERGIVPGGCISEQSDVAMKTLGHINDRWQLRGVTSEQANVISDKELQRRALAAQGLSQPAQFRCRSLRQAEIAADQLWSDGLFAVIKPVSGQGSSGVFLDMQGSRRARLRRFLPSGKMCLTNG